MAHACVWANAEFAPIIRMRRAKTNKIFFVGRTRKRRVGRSFSSRILIQLPCGIALFVLLEIIDALVPLTGLISGPRQPRSRLFRRSRCHGVRDFASPSFEWFCLIKIAS